MKRSRRVVLTMMGTAAGAVSMGFVRRSDCGPGLMTVPGPNGLPYCRPVYYGGFGGAPHRLYGQGVHGGHAHGGG
jgi:hypothetical protein